jgi:amyloid beta precursor protein binding protein 1
MDVTDHAHIPYVLILVRAMHDWKREVSVRVLIHTFSLTRNQHGGKVPQTYTEKQAFKDAIGLMKRKPDEENFDEALAQAYRAWTPTTLPSHLTALFSTLPDTLPPRAPHFSHLLLALKQFTAQNGGHLPVVGKVPDMKADTRQYVALQRLYRATAATDAAKFRALLNPAAGVSDEVVDLFLKNAHAVQRLQGTQWGALDCDAATLGTLTSLIPCGE